MEYFSISYIFRFTGVVLDLNYTVRRLGLIDKRHLNKPPGKLFTLQKLMGLLRSGIPWI